MLSTLTDEQWHLNNQAIASGEYNGNKQTCDIHSTGLCTSQYDQKEEKCLKRGEEFNETYFFPHNICNDPSKVSFAL